MRKIPRNIKLPFIDICIARFSDVTQIGRDHDILEEKMAHELFIKRIRAKIDEKNLHQIAVTTGRLKAPICERCGRPKVAGGIIWIDHKNCPDILHTEVKDDKTKDSKSSADGLADLSL